MAPLISTATAADFDGVNDYFTIPHAESLNAQGAFSIEIWLRLDSPTAERLHPIASKSGYSNSPGQWSVYYDNRTGQKSLRVLAGVGTNTGVDWANCDAEMAAGGHLVVTVSGAGPAQSVRIYWNGVERASKGGVAITWSGGNTQAVDSHLASSYFDGVLDEFAIYHTALSPARVLAHYQEGI